jgi:hypothetical protein
MATFSPYGAPQLPGLPGTRVNAPFPGALPGGIRPGFGGDVDPITPGVQTRPGVITATGQTQFVQGGGVQNVGSIPGQGFISRQPGFIPGAPGAIGIQGGVIGGISGGVAGGVIDADPITPGIQSQPGVVTPVGPPRVVGGPQIGIGGGIGGVIDADPITPGIQAQPGVVTPIGAPVVVGNAGIGGGAFGIDADPITPGVQGQRGVLTATGPSTVVGGGMLTSGVVSGLPVGLQTNVLTSGINRSGFQQNIVGGGLIDADPITPGIQAQPGIVTPVGPPTVVSSGIKGGSLGFGGPIVDADPITPGIQAQAGVITATGPSTVVGNTGGFGSTVVGGGLIDADPFTPGIQAQPGVITATGPSTVVGYQNQAGVYPGYGGYGYQQSCCPWWLWLLLGILLLGSLIGGLLTYFLKRRASS